MESRIFQLCIVFAVVEIFHHAFCTTTGTDTSDNLISPPPARLTALPYPITPPLIVVTPSTLWAARNYPVAIPCLVQWFNGEDDDDINGRGPTVRWLRNGKPMESGGGMMWRGVATSGTEGRWECVVEWGGGDGAVRGNSVELRIASLHEVTVHPEDTEVQVGQPAVFFCSGNSNPPANITWQKKDLPISNFLNPDSYVILPTGTLLIKKVQVSDVGSYKCKAANSVLNKSRLSKRVKLRLQQKDSSIIDAEILATAMETNKTTIYGEAVNLYCFAKGNPEPNIQWYKDGIIVGNSNILRILNVTEDHSGNYKCMAANNISTSYQYYTLNVLRPPYFNVTPESMSFPSAKTVRLHCEAIGNPPPKISWLKNGSKLASDGRVKLLKSTLVLSHSFSTDAGIYQCVAENSVARIWSAARLSITMPFGQPQPPQNVTCRPYETNTICVQWCPPHGLNASAYSVHTTDVQSTRMLTEQVTNDTNMIVHSLRPNTTYSFYVRGYVRSASDQSVSVQCTTLARPTGSPVLRRRFTVELLNDSSAWLTWQELSNDVPCVTPGKNPGEVWYRLQWRHITASSMHTLTHTTTLQGRRYLLSALIPSTPDRSSRYRFHVIALPSPPQSLFPNTTKSTYISPISTNSNTNNNNNIHPEFEYTMPLAPYKSGNNVLAATVYDEDELLGLDEDDEFDDGEEEDMFLPPYGLGAQLVGHDAVRLSWEDDNVNVEFYMVCYGVVGEDVGEGSGCGGVGGEGRSRQEYLKCATKSVQVNKLLQNTLYEFRVRGHALDGITSVYSDPIQLNTMDLMSSAVQNLDYFIINASCVCVTWQQPSFLQNSSYTNYTVAYTVKQTKSEEGWHYITVTSAPGVKQNSCYRSDDSTTLLPFGNPIPSMHSSDMSLLLSELKPSLNYSLYVQLPGSSPGVTITISTKNAVVFATVNKELEYTNEDDLAQIDRVESTRREQIMGAIVGVCVSVSLLSAVVCAFKIWPWWRRRRDDRQRRLPNMSHLNGGTDTVALTRKGPTPHVNHNTRPESPPTLTPTPFLHIPTPQQHITNNNGTSIPYGNGVGMRRLLRNSDNCGQRDARGSESDCGGGGGDDDDGGGGGGRGLTMMRVAGAGEGEGVELRMLLSGTEENRKSVCIHITENPQYTSNGISTDVDYPPVNDILPSKNNNHTNYRRQQHQQQQLTDNTVQDLQLLSRRQSPALAPNG